MSKTIEELEKLDQAKFQNLCDDLLSFYFGYQGIIPVGINTKKQRTISGTPDSIIFLSGDEAIAFEYTTDNKSFSVKLKEDLKAVKEKLTSTLKQFVFVSNRKRQNIDTINPELYIKKNYGWDAQIIDQETLRVALDNSDFFYLRRKYLNIPEDYFLNRENFEKITYKRRGYLPQSRIFVGRQQDIEEIKAFILNLDSHILLIHSVGGIGKTRLITEVIKHIENDLVFSEHDFMFNKIQSRVEVGAHIHELPKTKKNVVILDDAHKIETLHDFKQLFPERPNTKIILTTRSTAKEKIFKDIGPYGIKEYYLKKLDNKEIYELLRANSPKGFKQDFLEYLASLCEGNPLLAEIYLNLLNHGSIKTVWDIKRSEPILDYFRDAISEIVEDKNQLTQKYEAYLSFIFILRPFSWKEQAIREIVRTRLRLDEIEESSIVRNLVNKGILEEVHDTLWVYPDLLGEYLTERTFFSNNATINFGEVFSAFSEKKTKSVLKALRDINCEGTRNFLKEFIKKLREVIKNQSNDQCLESIGLLDDISYVAPEETIELISSIIYSKEKKPVKYDEPFESLGREHKDILAKCIDVLDSIKYHETDHIVELLLYLHFYKINSKHYVNVRQKALDTLLKIANYDLPIIERYGYSYQVKLLKKADEWKRLNFSKYVDVILKLCESFLSVEFEHHYLSPIDSRTFHFGHGPLPVTEELKKLRSNTLSLLQEIFFKVKNVKTKLSILSVLNKATRTPIKGIYGKDLSDMIQVNTESLVDFYLKVLQQNDFPVVWQEIEKHAKWIKSRWKDAPRLSELFETLNNNQSYELYRTLIGSDHDYYDEEDKDWKERRKKREEKIESLINKIDNENLMYWVMELSKIAGTYPLKKDSYEFNYFRWFLVKLGNKSPRIVKSIIDKTLSKNTPLKLFIPLIVRGIRFSESKDIADIYVKTWLDSSHIDLIEFIPQTYYGVEDFKEQDINIIDKLVKLNNSQLDIQIIDLIPDLYKINPARVLKLLHKITKRGDEKILRSLAWNVLDKHPRSTFNFEKWNEKTYSEIIWAFVKVPDLDWHMLSALTAFGERFPLRLIDFFEARIKEQKKRQRKRSNILTDRYDAIPFESTEIGEMYSKHPQYPKVIDKILGWLKKKDYVYQWEGQQLLSNLSPSLDKTLEKKLQELILTGKKENILVTVKALRRFNGTVFDLYKDAIKSSKGDKDVCSIISTSIGSTGIVEGERGMINAYDMKIKFLEDWLKEEDRFIHEFAKREIDYYKRRIEQEERQVALEEIARRKGV
jgi:hypothetical protein